jgi:hypothetical protein
VGGARFPSPRCRWLDPAETVLLIESYRDAHPRAWRRIARMFGFPADPSGLAAVAERIPAVAFRPADEAHDPSHGP